LTALALVGALACGVLLASDVFGSGARVDTLLFGSLLVVGGRDPVLAGAAGVLAAVASTMLGERWLARGFDPDAARYLGLRSRWPAPRCWRSPAAGTWCAPTGGRSSSPRRRSSPTSRATSPGPTRRSSACSSPTPTRTSTSRGPTTCGRRRRRASCWRAAGAS